MAFSLPDLPYAKDALAPHISSDTLDYHYGKHHAAYVNNLNGLIEGTDLAHESLENVIKSVAGDDSKIGIFNNAAQVWNHTFYWHCMKPGGGDKPTGDLAARIDADFGSYDALVDEMKKAGAPQFGSGWAWLVLNTKTNKLEVTKTANAETPLTNDHHVPLLTCDVWEHAYYLDYQNKRPDYLGIFFDHLVNWDFAAENLSKAA